MPKPKQAETRDTDVYFSLNDLMHLGSMSGAVLLTGQNCMDCKVVRTNVVEVANLLDWVGPNELVISSGYSFRDHEEDLAALLAGLQKKGVSALCLKPRRFRDGLSEQVVAQAAQLGFPLIQLPMAAVFANIVHESMEAILNKETQSFRIVQDRMEQLLEALWKEENPEECLHVVEEMMGNPVMIFDSESEFIVSPKSRDLISQSTQEELMKQLYHRNGQSTFRLSGKPAVPVHIFDVSAQSGIRIILLEYYNPLRHIEELILRRIVHILALEMKNFLAIKKIRRKYKQQFMEDWLGGRLGDTVSICVAAHAEGYSLSAECSYRVAIVNLNTSQSDAAFVERDISIIRHIIRNLNSNILFNVLEGKLLLVFQDDPSGESSLHELSTLTKKVNYIMDKGEMSFCISDPSSVQGIAEAYGQARKISQISSRCGLREQVITHDKLGILYLLALLPEDASVQRFRARFLDPLKEYDRQHKSALTETLRVYLETGCNTMQTAKLLHAHYNTVAYRLSNAEKLLSLSVGDVETQLQLRIAYKLDLIQ